MSRHGHSAFHIFLLLVSLSLLLPIATAQYTHVAIFANESGCDADSRGIRGGVNITAEINKGNCTGVDPAASLRVLDLAWGCVGEFFLLLLRAVWGFGFWKGEEMGMKIEMED